MNLPVRALARAVWLLVVLLANAAPSRAQDLASECQFAPNGPSHLAVGTVDCLRFDSAMMGGVVPFTYYVPAACDPALGRKCPVLYLLHGLTGSYQVMLGARGGTSHSFVHALTSGPPVDPRTVPEPWVYESPSTWVAKPPLDFILIAPHGVTLVDGYNPTPGQAKDCAMSGISYGGIGTGHIGLRRPDLFSSLHQISFRTSSSCTRASTAIRTGRPTTASGSRRCTRTSSTGTGTATCGPRPKCSTTAPCSRTSPCGAGSSPSIARSTSS